MVWFAPTMIGRGGGSVTYTVVLGASAKRGVADEPPTPAAVHGLICGPLADNPRLAGTPMLHHLLAYWTARCGRWRVLYEIIDSRQEVIVHRIERRAEHHPEAVAPDSGPPRARPRR